MLDNVSFVHVMPGLGKALLHYYDHDENRHVLDLTPKLGEIEDRTGTLERNPSVLRDVTWPLIMDGSPNTPSELSNEYYIVRNTTSEIIKYVEDYEKRD